MENHIAGALAVALVLASSSVLADDKAKREFVHEANVMARSVDDADSDADAGAPKDKSQQEVGPVRWMAPESLRKSPSSSAPQSRSVPHPDVPNSREKRTDKDKAKRSDRSAPCPALPPEKTAPEPGVPESETGKSQGCN